MSDVLNIHLGIPNYGLRIYPRKKKKKDLNHLRNIYETALMYCYGSGDIWVQYGQFELKQGHPDQAKEIWEYGLEYVPHDAEIWFKRINLAKSLKEHEDVERLYRRWMALGPVEAWTSYFNYKKKEFGKTPWNILTEMCESANQMTAWDFYLKECKKKSNQGRLASGYIQGIGTLGLRELTGKLFTELAEIYLQTGNKKTAREILEYGMNLLDKAGQEEIMRYESNGKKEKAVTQRKILREIKQKIEDNRYDYKGWEEYLEYVKKHEDKEKEKMIEEFLELVPNVEDWEKYVKLIISNLDLISKRDIGRSKKILETQIIRNRVRTIEPVKSLWILMAKMHIDGGEYKKGQELYEEYLEHERDSEVYKDLCELIIDPKYSPRSEVNEVSEMFQRWVAKYRYDINIWVAYVEMTVKKEGILRGLEICEEGLRTIIDKRDREELWIMKLELLQCIQGVGEMDHYYKEYTHEIDTADAWVRYGVVKAYEYKDHQKGKEILKEALNRFFSPMDQEFIQARLAELEGDTKDLEQGAGIGVGEEGEKMVSDEIPEPNEIPLPPDLPINLNPPDRKSRKDVLQAMEELEDMAEEMGFK